MIKWEQKKTSLGNAIVLSGIAAFIGVIVGINWTSIASNFAPALNQEATQTSSVDWSPLNEVYNKLSSTYNGDLSEEVLIEGAKKGIAAALEDPYTVYMDNTETSDFYNDLHGNVGSGVGIVMGLRDGYVRVLRTLPDNPAEEAGILAGDILYKVNGEDVYNLSTEEITNKVRGEDGTEVTIDVVRNGEQKTFTMKRETLNNVSAYVDYDGNTAIITVERFDNDTGTQVQKIAQEFKDKGVNKVILDLRGNGGGYVDAAEDLLSLWLDGEDIATQKSKHFGDSTNKTSSGKAILSDIETVVLVDEVTASASEIVAGALQDYGKATIVGKQTFGKGVVQNLYDLSGGTLLKVTTAEWYTPNGASINGTGIKPDVEVERTYEDINAMRDPQLDKAKEL